MLDTRAVRLQSAAWLGVGAALLGLIYLLAPMLAPFVVAAVLAYICNPAVDLLVARRVPRAIAVLLVILALGLGLLLLVLILAPMVYREAAALIARLPDLLELLNAKALPLIKQHFDVQIKLDAASLRKWVSEHWSTAQDLLPLLLDNVKVGGLALLGVFANLLLVPVVMFYLLQEWPQLMANLKGAIPRPLRARTLRLTREVDRVLSEFLRGQISVMLLLALYYSIGLWLAGLNFALPVGTITGMLSFIPYVGFSSGLVLGILSAILQGEGWAPLIGVAAVFGLGQLLESFVLTPYLVGERIGLHPLAVIFALMAFGELFGFVGVLIALPASAALLVALRRVRHLYLQSHIYRGRPREGT